MIKIIVFLAVVLTLARSQPVNQPLLAGVTWVGQTVDPLTLAKGTTILDVNSGQNMCVTSDNKWSYPCVLSVESQETTTLSMNANSYSSTTDYTYDGTTKVDFSASVGYGPFSAQASYSEGTKNYVNTMITQGMTFVSSDVTMELYVITTPVLTAPLGSEFTGYINTLASKLESGDNAGYQTWFAEFAVNVKYLVETTVTTGGQLMQTQYVTNSYYSNTNDETVTNCIKASASFANAFSVSGYDYWGVTTTEVDQFKSSSSYTQTTAIGGPYIAGQTIEEWQESAMLNPGVLSYSMSKASQWINPSFFPLLNPVYVQKIHDDYEAVWQAYINSNSWPGCTDQFAINFNLSATVEDDSCQHVYETGSSFGGAYGVETRTNIEDATTYPTGSTTAVNPQTNTLGCPSGTSPHCITLASEGGEMKGVVPVGASVEETLCFCMSSLDDNSQASYGGLFGNSNQVPPVYSYWTGTLNLNGGPSCPPSFTGKGLTFPQYWLVFCDEPSVVSYKFGGIYFVHNGECVPNPYTGTCGCPSEAPLAAEYSLTVHVNFPNAATDGSLIAVCWGQPALITNSNPGPFPSLNPMTSQAPPVSTTGVPSKDKNNHVITIVVASVCLCIVLLTIFTCCFFYCLYLRKQNKQQNKQYDYVRI